MKSKQKLLYLRLFIFVFIWIASWNETFQLPSAMAQDYEREPINYGTAKPVNVISELCERLDSDDVKLNRDPETGYLASLLSALDVPTTSQMLVFSKTSLQRHRISPKTPRAIYFNDDVYVGYCQKGDVIEISAVDPQLGAVFYTLDQADSDRPRPIQQMDNCLLCHGSSPTHGVPGHFVRSVYVDHEGFPVLSLGSNRIDQTSAIEKRWGGWYVTGTHGAQTHRGNLTVSEKQDREPVENAAGQNVTNLVDRFPVEKYLTPHSDLVALMVMEHQAEAQNLLTRASFQVREALYAEERLNKDLNEPPGHRWQSTTTRIQSAGNDLVKYLLFSGETRLTNPLKGTSAYADEFSKRGPRDQQGRSLRDFDLQTRLFKYPCSYLIYSKTFDQLHSEQKEFVYKRLFDVLRGVDQSKEFAHLSNEDRVAIREILIDTKPDLPQYWKESINPLSVPSN